ncbi:MAG: putative toxin-antitoxin system toxin component, PIN family [Verrucomicrobiota bacterium]
MRAVLDTNVIIASFLSSSSEGTGAQLLDRWRSGQFQFLFSRDTMLEYAEVLLRKGVPQPLIQSFLTELYSQGEVVTIVFFHLPTYPTDTDDIAFLLCALNGQAQYLISYDNHLLDLAPDYELLITEPFTFLKALISS